MNRKVVWTLGVLVLAAALLALPGPAKAEMYVEGYLGGVTAGGLDSSTNIHTANFNNISLRANLPGHPNAAVIGGLKIGYWFVPTGFGGYSYPDWMKYLGVYTDFSYHRLDVRQTQFTLHARQNNNQFANIQSDFESEGTVATWAFMLAARYGFFQDSEVPFGRLQPYIAVGPAVMFSTQRPKVGLSQTPFGISSGSESSADIALAVDAGIRYMCLKNVSIDLSFKYRYANPTYSFRGHLSNPVLLDIPTSFKYEPVYNLFSGQLGVAYHF